ncbi:MAG TPA: topoisomerase C-terminal repeat-containing protein, partial [Acetobacteraceae bacterium]|nr:topoisomerase C-terminal repeat-containing protein [Acetobacteraceae bacterium]
SVGLNRAVMVLAKKQEGIRSLGPHPKDGEPVVARKGRFGPYVQHGKSVANLPRGSELEQVTLDEAVALLAEKGKVIAPRGRKGKTKAAEPAPRAKPAAKARAKPAARKKTAMKRTAKG